MCAMSLLLWLYSSGSLAVWCTGRTQRAPLLSVEAVVVIWWVRPKPFGGGWIICVHNLYCVMNSVPIECTQEGGYTHTRTHAHTHARTHARTLFAPAQYVCLWDDVIAFWQNKPPYKLETSLRSGRDSFPLLFTEFAHPHWVGLLYLWLRVRVYHCTRRVASPLPDRWTRPFFIDWAHRFLTDFNFLGVKYWQSLTHAAVHTSVSCATAWMEI